MVLAATTATLQNARINVTSLIGDVRPDNRLGRGFFEYGFCC